MRKRTQWSIFCLIIGMLFTTGCELFDLIKQMSDRFMITGFSPNQVISAPEKMPKSFSISFTNPPKIMPDYFRVVSLNADGGETPVPGTLTVKFKTLVFTPKKPFDFQLNYQMSIRTLYESENGNRLEGSEVREANGDWITYRLPYRKRRDLLIKGYLPSPKQEDGGRIQLFDTPSASSYFVVYLEQGNLYDNDKFEKYFEVKDSNGKIYDFRLSTGEGMARSVALTLSPYFHQVKSTLTGSITIKKNISNAYIGNLFVPLPMEEDLIIPFRYHPNPPEYPLISEIRLDEPTQIGDATGMGKPDSTGFHPRHGKVTCTYCPKTITIYLHSSLAYNQEEAIKSQFNSHSLLSGCQVKSLTTGSSFIKLLLDPPFSGKPITLKGKLTVLDKKNQQQEDDLDLQIYYEHFRSVIESVSLAPLNESDQIESATLLTETADLKGYATPKKVLFIFKFTSVDGIELAANPLPPIEISSESSDFHFETKALLTPFSGEKFGSTEFTPDNAANPKILYFAVKGELQFPDDAQSVMWIQCSKLKDKKGLIFKDFNLAVNI